MNIIWNILMYKNFRWFLFLAVLVLNFIAYYQDPTRYTIKNQCFFNTPCKWFDYITGMGTFTLDVLTFIGLWYTISPLWLRDTLPDYWYIPFIIIGYAIISQITIDSPIYKDNEDALNKPPKYLWSLKWRMILYGIILLLDICIFTQMFIDSSINDYSKNFKIFDFLIKNRFGGWGEGNYVQFIFSWLGIFGLLADLLSLYYVSIFNACDYGLPISWNY